MSERLDGHFTMLLDGECFTFPIDRFHYTQVVGWGPGVEGTYECHAWSAESVAAWEESDRRYKAAQHRWGWLHRVALRVPVRDHDGWDEDGEDLGRSWKWARVGPLLAGRLMPERPPSPGVHLIANNQAESYALMHTEGVKFLNNSHTDRRGPLMPSKLYAR